MFRRVNTMTSHQFDRGKFERSLLAMLRVDRCIDGYQPPLTMQTIFERFCDVTQLNIEKWALQCLLFGVVSQN